MFSLAWISLLLHLQFKLLAFRNHLSDRVYYLARLDDEFLCGQKIILSVKPEVAKRGISTHPIFQQRELLSKTVSVVVKYQKYPDL